MQCYVVNVLQDVCPSSLFLSRSYAFHQMEQTPVLTRRFHVRMVTLLVAVAVLDGYLAWGAGTSVLRDGISMQLLFGFEVGR